MRYAKTNSRKNFIVAIVVVIILILVAVVGFVVSKNLYNSKNDETPSSSAVSSRTSKTSPEEQENIIANDLTGLKIDEKFKNNRPIAIMINNLDGAQPLLGVCDADLMYECPVEGGITRILAVFKNPSGIEKIGSVRSARPYFINIAQGLDAIYMHIGGSTQATEMLKSSDIDSFSLGSYGDMMYRDPERRANLGYEHSALTSGERLLKGIEDAGTRTALKPDYKFKQTFSKETSQVNNGSQAKKIEAVFSNYKSTVFDYNEDKETYMISQFDEPQMDDNSKQQNSKQNVILLKASVSTIDDKSDLKAVGIIGSGNGKYISHGKVIDIKWSKASATDPIKYTTTDNQELVMIPGQCYICVLPLEANVSIS